MSKKRSSTESNEDEQTRGPTDSSQQDDAKRAKLSPSSSATLQDLPIDLLESILVRAVALDVLNMKLVKRVWEEKADLVISRYRTVCKQWRNILTTNIFRNRVHNILDDTVEKTIRLMILHQSRVPSYVFRVATIRDDVFMLCLPSFQEPCIEVRDRSDNMQTLKDIIPLVGILPKDMVACSASDCVYVLSKEAHCYSVLRVKKDGGPHFEVSPWITDLCPSYPTIQLFVSVNGSLVALLKAMAPSPSVVIVYDAQGSIQNAVTLFPTYHQFRFIFSVVQKSDGNLVLGTIGESLNGELKEIDIVGKIVRQYQSSIFGDTGVLADADGRILVAGIGNTAEVLDSELNSCELTVTRQNQGLIQIPYGMDYNRDRNEMVRLFRVENANPFAGLIFFTLSST